MLPTLLFLGFGLQDTCCFLTFLLFLISFLSLLIFNLLSYSLKVSGLLNHLLLHLCLPLSLLFLLQPLHLLLLSHHPRLPRSLLYLLSLYLSLTPCQQLSLIPDPFRLYSSLLAPLLDPLLIEYSLNILLPLLHQLLLLLYHLSIPLLMKPRDLRPVYGRL